MAKIIKKELLTPENCSELCSEVDYNKDCADKSGQHSMCTFGEMPHIKDTKVEMYCMIASGIATALSSVSVDNQYITAAVALFTMLTSVGICKKQAVLREQDIRNI